MVLMRLSVLIPLLIFVAACADRSMTKRVPTPEDVERLRRHGSIMTLSPADQRVVYANMEKIAETTTVRRSARPLELPHAPADLSSFRYTHAGRSRSLTSFMADLKVVGLIVIKDGRIVVERYADGHDGETPWTAFSVVKSVTSLLFGAALQNGHLRSLDEYVADYLPELAGSAYDGVTLRQLLQMSSGVAWNPNLADKSSDTYALSAIDRSGGFKALIEFLAAKPQEAAPGSRFNYNTAEADLAGAILYRATGRGLSEYLTDYVWQPFGMEADGHWLIMRGERIEHGDCCLSTTLRDLARLGLLALNDGVSTDGVRLLPEGWIAESTRPSPAFPGYGYYWWLRKTGSYFASGSFGQHLEVDPAARVVVAIQSYWPLAYSDDLIAHNDAFVSALSRSMR